MMPELEKDTIQETAADAQAAAPTATPAMKGTATFAGVRTSRGRTRTGSNSTGAGRRLACKGGSLGRAGPAAAPRPF